MRLILSFLLVVVFSLFGKERFDFLFYLQDAGETNGLMPVIEKLEIDGYSVALLASGMAEEILTGRSVWTFSDFGEKKVTKSWGRGEEISEDTLNALFEAIDPRVVVTGVAFRAQGQVLDLYRDRPTFAFWDNFNSRGENPYFTTARDVAPLAHVLLLPSQTLIDDFPEIGEKKVVGQPTLERWREEIGSADANNPPLFIGGYGKEYEEAFALFIDCAEISGRPYFVQPHPKTDGSFERTLLANRPGLSIQISEEPTLNAVSKAPLVICHQSTVGFQALACGKPVIHIIPKGQVFDSLPLQKGLAHRVSSPEEFCCALEEARPISSETFHEILGIPDQSILQVVQTLTEAIPISESHEPKPPQRF